LNKYGKYIYIKTKCDTKPRSANYTVYRLYTKTKTTLSMPLCSRHIHERIFWQICHSVKYIQQHSLPFLSQNVSPTSAV